MNSLTDQQLLCDYAHHRSEPAFSELARRHVDFVYSAALRMVRDAQLAEDVTQAVFVALSKNAGQLLDHPVLSGWLHRTAQNLAANVVRTEIRRRAREQEAFVMNELLAHEPEAEWKTIAPHLDTALGELSEPDRDALLLRYFERKSAGEMAGVLNVSEEAAQKRVNRAVERLREFFSKRNVTVGTSGLVVLISTNAIQAAPAGLAVTISSAISLAGTAVQTSTILAMTALQKTLVTATIAILAGVGFYESREASRLRGQVQTLQQQQAPMSKQVAELKQSLIDATNQLAALRDDNERLNRNTAELLRLRNQLNMLRQETSKSSSASMVIEPNYEGRTLSEWLSDLDIPRPVSGNYEQNPTYAKAAAAIRALGSKTFLYLLKLLSGGSGDVQMRQAVRAFEVLGSQANTLIPQFENLFEKSPGYSLHALAAIGKDSTPILIKSLTHENTWVRNNAAAALTQNLYDNKITPEEAADALPIAIQCLNYSGTDPNNSGDDHAENMRWRAASLVGALGLEPKDSIPALVSAMDHSGESVVLECARALEKFDSAKAAIPALTRVVNSTTNENVRRMAQDALSRIQKR